MRRTIDVAVPVVAGSADVTDVMRRGPAVLFGDEAGISRPSDDALSDFRSDLHFGGPNGSVHHEVMVHLADSPELPRSWTMTIEPVRPSRFLPSFQGTIAVVDDGGRLVVRVSGAYEPPLGLVGAFGDGLVGFRLARSSLESFVLDIARRIDRAVSSRALAAPSPVMTPDLDLRDVVAGSENWLG